MNNLWSRVDIVTSSISGDIVFLALSKASKLCQGVDFGAEVGFIFYYCQEMDD